MPVLHPPADAVHDDEFAAILYATPDCVTIVDHDGTLLQINAAGLSALGAPSADTVVGRSLYDLVAPEFRDLYRRFNQEICSGKEGSLEFQIVGPGGTRRHMQTTAVPLKRANGNVNLAVTRDITEPKRMEGAALLLSAIVESSDDAIISKNLDGVITSWNRSAERLFGYTSEEALGKTVADLLIPADRQHEEPEILSRLRQGERVDHFETKRKRKDGTLVDISLTISPVKDRRGRVVGASKIARDITERKRAEGAALLLGEIVRSSDDAIISKDLNGVITSWNKSAERLFGYTADEAIGKSVGELLIPDDRQQEEPAILAKLRLGERVEHFETVRKRKDDTLREISLTISPLKDAQGRVVGASKIARDISDRRRTERAIAELNEQLKLDLTAMTRMQQLSTRLVETSEFPLLLEEILSAGMDITGADAGNIQLIQNGVLSLIAHRRLDGSSTRTSDTGISSDPASTAATRSRQRVFIESIRESTFLDGQARQAMMNAGVHALQSTPLISRAGEVLGTFATHYAATHRASERELRLLDILARLAADLIERTRNQAALVESEGRFRQLANSMPQIVWTARSNGEVDYYNDRWFELSGQPRNDPEGGHWQALVHPDDVNAVRESWIASVRTGNHFAAEHRLWDAQHKQWRWFITRALSVRNDTGETVRWFGSSTDIDELKRVEAELRQANRDLEQFAFSASHDLQEPLRTVTIYSELLGRRYAEQLDGDALEFLRYVRTGATRMEMLVKDLLAYTRVTTIEEQTHAVNANEVLHEALENLAGTIAEARAVVTADHLPTLHVHTTHLQQLFQNLLGNAIKYRSPDRAPNVHVTAQRDRSNWLFSISDNGIGIDPQYKVGIFGLFKRLHSGDSYPGTGIGLAICQRIVDRYRGRIWVESEPGRGSTFHFTLPV